MTSRVFTPTDSWQVTGKGAAPLSRVGRSDSAAAEGCESLRDISIDED